MVKHPSARTAARRGRGVRREFEHIRNGTVSVIAALEAATGQVIAGPIARNDSWPRPTRLPRHEVYNGGGPAARLLVVEDEPTILELLSGSLRFAGFDVLTASSGAEALRAVAASRPDCGSAARLRKAIAIATAFM